MKILFIIGQLGCGGAERQTYLLCNRLKEAGYVIHVAAFSRTNSFYDKDLMANGIAVHFIEGNYLTKCQGIIRLITKVNPDLLHSVFWYGGIYAAVYFMFHRKIPLVAGERGEIKGGVQGRILRNISYYFADVIAFNSKRTLESLKAPLTFYHNKMMYIPNGFEEPNQHKFTYTVPQSPKIICAVNSLYPHKRTEWIINAFYESKATQQGFLLHIAGEGPEKQHLEKLISGYGLSAFVTFVGVIKNVAVFLEPCWFFAFASAYEGMPNVVAEAMFARKPVLSTDVGDVRALIPDEKYGCVVSSDNYSLFAESFSAFLNCFPSKLQQIGDTAYHRIKENFSLTRMANSYISVYSNLISKKKICS